MSALAAICLVSVRAVMAEFKPDFKSDLGEESNVSKGEVLFC